MIILLPFSLQSVTFYITYASNMGMYSNVMTDKTEFISVKTEHPPAINGINNSYIDYSVHNTPNQNFLQKFKIDDVNKCWNYCKFTSSCLFFSFQLITGRCSLYTKLSIVPNWYGSLAHTLACGRFTTAMTIIRTLSVSLSMIQTGAWKLI